MLFGLGHGAVLVVSAILAHGRAERLPMVGRATGRPCVPNEGAEDRRVHADMGNSDVEIDHSQDDHTLAFIAPLLAFLLALMLHAFIRVMWMNFTVIIWTIVAWESFKRLGAMLLNLHRVMIEKRAELDELRCRQALNQGRIQSQQRTIDDLTVKLKKLRRLRQANLMVQEGMKVNVKDMAITVSHQPPACLLLQKVNVDDMAITVFHQPPACLLLQKVNVEDMAITVFHQPPACLLLQRIAVDSGSAATTACTVSPSSSSDSVLSPPCSPHATTDASTPSPSSAAASVATKDKENVRTAVDDLSVQQEELGHLREASLMAQEDMNAHIEDIVVSVPRQSPACVPPQPSTVGSESVAMTACTVSPSSSSDSVVSPACSPHATTAPSTPSPSSATASAATKGRKKKRTKAAKKRDKKWADKRASRMPVGALPAKASQG